MNTMHLEFIDLHELPMEALKKLKGSEILTEGSRKAFEKWCSEIKVLRAIHEYPEIITNHKEEMRYRNQRQKEFPFGRPELGHSYYTKIQYRDNIPVIPITVAENNTNRAYRLVEAIHRCVHELGGTFTVDRSSSDNATIDLHRLSFSFCLSENKSSRRDIGKNSTIKVFRPMYEQIFDDSFTMIFKMKMEFNSWVKMPERVFIYTDNATEIIELQLDKAFSELINACCDYKLTEVMQWRSMKDKEDAEKVRQEELSKRQREQKNLDQRISYQKALITNMEPRMKSWFLHDQYARFADELESYIFQVDDCEVKQYLIKYVELVREEAAKSSPINLIIEDLKNAGISIEQKL